MCSTTQTTMKKLFFGLICMFFTLSGLAQEQSLAYMTNDFVIALDATQDVNSDLSIDISHSNLSEMQIEQLLNFKMQGVAFTKGAKSSLILKLNYSKLNTSIDDVLSLNEWLRKFLTPEIQKILN